MRTWANNYLVGQKPYVIAKEHLMRIRLMLFMALAAITLVLTAGPLAAKGPKDDAKEAEEALVKNAEAFVEAFHKADAKALAAFWSPEGDYTDQRGRIFKGREAIEKAFAEVFEENKDLKLRINIGSIRFTTPDVAIEDGTTEVQPPNGPPSRARYTVVHVKKEGKWLIDSVRDAMYVSPTNYEFLRGLEFAIGDWVAEAETGEGAHLSFAWAPHQNFIINTFTTTFKNVSLGSGTQWIGWDPKDQKIRTWTFDTSGGFGGGVMTKDGDNKWVIKVRTVQRDGKETVATNTVTRVDRDTVTWESKDRTVDGKEVPEIKPIKLKRVK
jgi:uncharacterized protein (TIGR02246 family)